MHVHCGTGRVEGNSSAIQLSSAEPNQATSNPAVPNQATSSSAVPHQATSSTAVPNQATFSPTRAAQDLATRRFSTGTLGAPPPATLGAPLPLPPEPAPNLDDVPLTVLAANLALMAAKAAEPAAAANSDAVQRPAKQQQAVERDGCGENCLNRLSNILCDPRSCPCGDRCSNRCALAPSLQTMPEGHIGY